MEGHVWFRREVHHDALVQSRPLCGAMAMTLREVS